MRRWRRFVRNDFEIFLIWYLQFKKSCATINIVFKQQSDEGDSVLVELTGRKHRRLRVHLKEAEQ